MGGSVLACEMAKLMWLLLYGWLLSHTVRGTSHEVFVMYSSSQVSLSQLLSLVKDISSDGIEILHDTNSTASTSATLVIAGEIALQFIDLDIGDFDESVSAIAVMIQNIFAAKKSWQNVTVIGPSSSKAANTVAQLIQRSGVSVDHIHTSPLPVHLGKLVRGTSIGISPPVDFLAEAGLSLIRHANWSQVLVIYEDSDIDMLSMSMRLLSVLQSWDDQGNFTVSLPTDKCNDLHSKRLASSIPINAESTSKVEKSLVGILRRHPIRILFLVATGKQARNLLCKMQSYKFPDYQWVILKTTLAEIATSEADGPCHNDVLMEVLSFAIFIVYGASTTISGIFDNHVLVGAYEQAIKCTVRKNCTCRNSLIIDNSYLFAKQLVLSYNNNSIAVSSRSFSALQLISSEFPTENQVTNRIIAIIALALCSVLFIVMALLHISTIYYHNSKSIRATSPKVQHIAFAGAYLILTDTVIYITYSGFDLKSSTSHFCNTHWFLLSLGLTVVTAVLAVHAWRLYRIFNHFCDPGALISDKYLMLIVVGMAAPNAILFSLWAIGRPDGYLAPCTIDYDRRIKVRTEQCFYKVHFYILFCGFVLYIFTILGFAVVFSFLTKQAIPKQLKQFRKNDIATLTYCYGLTILVGFPVFTVVHITNDITFVFFIGLIIHFSLVLSPLVLLFAAPVYQVWKEKRSDGILDYYSGSNGAGRRSRLNNSSELQLNVAP